jgi:3-oxoacyl-[acyl-carrier protein] reductase
MFEELRERVAVVTGGGRGIGKAIAHCLSKHGARSIVADIDLDAAQATARSIAASGGAAEARPLDVGDPAMITAFVKAALDAHGHLDILVNNAGIVSRVNAAELSVDLWDRTLDVNLRGAFLLTREILPVMQRQKSGAIVNVSSLAGLNGGIAVGPDYVASKAGLIGLTRHFARLAASSGVRVNALCPGIIGSEATTRLGEAKMEELRKIIPLGRIGSVEEVAKVVLFLASDMSSYITGETVIVTGGIFA